jgi:hypothetical protein
MLTALAASGPNAQELVETLIITGIALSLVVWGAGLNYRHRPLSPSLGREGR